ncbi:MAG TPA: murein L,D-transpeptidase catalytic domain family protein [Flavobacterium sp.]|nr:murein L,D-transpeptidase catalytic domain family protein [Flavobacterium sp.]
MRYLSLLLLFLCCGKPAEKPAEPEPKTDYKRFHVEARTFCEQEGMNTDYYFLVDLKVHSGKPRFFIYDFSRGTIVDQNLVTHGACDVTPNPTKWETARFSDEPDSHCSAKGKYKIGKRDYSSWGIHVKYWLHGLEATNRSAEERVIVLHSWSAVKDGETYPAYSPLSWGCPAVSDAFMRKLDARLKQSRKPVLLWIVG